MSDKNNLDAIMKALSKQNGKSVIDLQNETGFSRSNIVVWLQIIAAMNMAYRSHVGTRNNPGLWYKL